MSECTGNFELVAVSVLRFCTRGANYFDSAIYVSITGTCKEVLLFEDINYRNC